MNDTTQDVSRARADRLKAVFSLHGNFEPTPASTFADKPRGHFCHPHALVDAGTTIGTGTQIWAFAHIVTGAVIGDDCNFCDHTFVAGGVRIGDRVTVKCGVYLWNGVEVEDDVFIGPAAVFTNDDRPRSKKYLAADLPTRLREGCSIGANSTTLPNVTIGRWAMVGAGAVVTRSVPDHDLVVGNPARWRAWVCRCGKKLPPGAKEVLHCTCGLAYKQVAERELRVIATGNHAPSWNGKTGADHPAAIIQSNGQVATNGQIKKNRIRDWGNTP